jgi:hypothetical protein
MSYPPPADQPPGYPPAGYAAQAPAVAYASWIYRVGSYIIDALPYSILTGIASAVDKDRGALYYIL